MLSVFSEEDVDESDLFKFSLFRVQIECVANSMDVLAFVLTVHRVYCLLK